VWRYLIEGPWLVFLAVWLVAAFNTRRNLRQESLRSRSSFLAVEITGYYLLFSVPAKSGVLSRPVLPPTWWLAFLGVCCTWLGIALALWARWSLGRNWSARVTLKEGHQLIRSGPYRYFRHPIYSGLDLAVIGAAVAMGRVRSLLGAALVILGYYIKAMREEKLLSQQFGPAFEDHRRQTGFLLPRLSNRGRDWRS